MRRVIGFGLLAMAFSCSDHVAPKSGRRSKPSKSQANEAVAQYDDDLVEGSQQEKESIAKIAPVFKTKRVAYVEINDDTIDLVGEYETEISVDGEEIEVPTFNVAVMFAANIRGSSGKADLYFNRQFKEQLGTNRNQIKELRANGIKVLMSVLNDHQDAGWSCFANYSDALEFAKELKLAVDTYELDGIEVDDEYDKCQKKYDNSLAMVASAIKSIMPNKILAKSLFDDIKYFRSSYQGKSLGDHLDMGWEMSYWELNCNRRASPYKKFMTMDKIGVGVRSDSTASQSLRIHRCLLDNNYGGGFMIFNLKRNSNAWVQSVMEPGN